MMLVPVNPKDATTMAVFYADPGSGALLWQLIGSFFIGLLFYVRRIAAWISPAREADNASQDAHRHEK